MSADAMDSKGGDEVDLMDELLDSGENFDELNDVADDRANRRRGGSKISAPQHSSDRLQRASRSQVSSKNQRENSKSEDADRDSSNGFSKSPLPKTSKKEALDDLTEDEDDLMDFEGSPRPLSLAGDKRGRSKGRDLSISDDSASSSRDSSVSGKDSDNEHEYDKQQTERSEEERRSISDKRRISLSHDDSEKSSSDKKGERDSPQAPPPKKKYDYSTKINYLFRDARFFLMKSNNEENIMLSKTKGVWSTPPQNEAKINLAVRECRNVILVYSVKESGQFCGFARVASESRRDLPTVNWVLPPGLSARALGGIFNLDWISKQELSFSKTLHLYNPWNEGKAVKIGRDGQEIEPRVAEELCRLIPPEDLSSLTSALLRSKRRAKAMASSSSSGSQARGPIRRPLSMPGDRRGGGFGLSGTVLFSGSGGGGAFRGFSERRGGGRGRGFSSLYRGVMSRGRSSRAGYGNTAAGSGYYNQGGGVRRKRYEEEDYEEAPRVKRARREEEDSKQGYSGRSSGRSRMDRSSSPSAYRQSSSANGRRATEGSAYSSSGGGGVYSVPPPPPKMLDSVPLSYQDFMMREMGRDFPPSSSSSSSRSSSSALPPMAFPPPPPFAPLSPPPRYYDAPPPMGDFSSTTSSSRSRSSSGVGEKSRASIVDSYDRSVDEFLLRNRDGRRAEGRGERRYRERQ